MTRVTLHEGWTPRADARMWSVVRRHLHRGGAPWFLLGDTAWELFRRLTEPEADHYLATRAAQGFNTVLAVALSEFDGLRVSSVAGHLPFEDLDPARPVEKYWRHIDRVVTLANQHGLTVGLLPTWGTNWHPERAFFDPVSARAYAGWIARRYRDHDVFWVLGGDRPITTDPHRAVIEAFAAGIREEIGDRQPITFHPNGQRSSADQLADADWLDFDMVQSGHAGWATPNYQMIEQDLARRPARPVLDAEPNYESHPVMSVDWRPVPGHFFDDADVRRAAYHSVFAGACGHVYGCLETWQMYDPDRSAPLYLARRPWREAVESPGAWQMGHLARLMAEVGFGDWEPAQDLIAAGRGILGAHQRAMAHRDRPGVLVYSPAGREVRLDLRRWPDQAWHTRWWDPANGRWLPDTAEIDTDRPVVHHPLPSRDGVLLLAPGARSE